MHKSLLKLCMITLLTSTVFLISCKKEEPTPTEEKEVYCTHPIPPTDPYIKILEANIWKVSELDIEDPNAGDIDWKRIITALDFTASEVNHVLVYMGGDLSNPLNATPMDFEYKVNSGSNSISIDYDYKLKEAPTEDGFTISNNFIVYTL